jgi:hypothetical protein
MIVTAYAVHAPDCHTYRTEPWEPPMPVSPCGGTYQCVTCGRICGWCFGAYDEHPDDCDGCVAEKVGRK